QPTPQPRHCPRFKQPHAPSDDGVLLSRRCWPELRYRAAARSRRGKVRSASERFHDVILYAHAVAIPNRAWLGWPRSHPWLAANRAEIRRQLLGAPRLFESLGEPPTPDSPPPPPMPAPEPNHAPLQVIDGNYERMSGVCPWWDAVKRGSRPI